eukprot:1110761-Prorocentrum_minimum.AAC.1
MRRCPVSSQMRRCLVSRQMRCSIEVLNACAVLVGQVWCTGYSWEALPSSNRRRRSQSERSAIGIDG